MVASVLAAGGLDPTVVVGGRVDALGSNAKLAARSTWCRGRRERPLLSQLSPILAVVTISTASTWTATRDMADVEQAFLTFIDKLPFYGAVTACVDNPLLPPILPPRSAARLHLRRRS